jgi:hypothetical protein
VAHLPDGLDLANAAAIPVDFPHGRPACAPCDKREKGTGCSDNRSAGQCWARGSAYGEKVGAQVLAIDDDKAIENFRLVDAIADTVGGDIAAKLIPKVRQSGSFGYTAVLPESAAAQNPTMKITRVRAQPDPSKLREFADDVRDGKFVLSIGRRMPLRDAAEAHVLGEKGGIGKILLLAPDSQH